MRSLPNIRFPSTAARIVHSSARFCLSFDRLLSADILCACFTLVTGCTCDAPPGFDGVIEDPRDAGRYTLPPTTLAAVKAAGMLQTVSLGAAASVGTGGEDGGHLTSDGVLARQQANVAKDIEELYAG